MFTDILKHRFPTQPIYPIYRRDISNISAKCLEDALKASPERVKLTTLISSSLSLKRGCSSKRVTTGVVNRPCLPIWKISVFGAADIYNISAKSSIADISGERSKVLAILAYFLFNNPCEIEYFRGLYQPVMWHWQSVGIYIVAIADSDSNTSAKTPSRYSDSDIPICRNTVTSQPSMMTECLLGGVRASRVVRSIRRLSSLRCWR